MPYARYREKEYPSTIGGRLNALSFFPPEEQGIVWGGKRTMFDYVGNPKGANPMGFTSDFRGDPAEVSGQVSPYHSASGWKYSPYLSHLPPSTEPPSVGSSMLSHLSRTNPGKPEVTVPVFIAELGEIPGMIKEVGEGLLKGVKHFQHPKKLAGTYLSWEFGWAPLISDIQKLLRFQKAVDDRIKEIEALRRKGIHRTSTNWEDDTSATTEVYPVASYNASFRCRQTIRTVSKRWSAATWFPTEPLPEANSEAMYKMAFEAVMGFGKENLLQNIWEGFPWSWLVGWFSNIGDLIGSTRNRIPVSADLRCVMTNTTTTYSLTPVYNYWGATITNGSNQLVTGGREIVVDTPIEFFLPFLDGRKASILSSLAILKFWK